ncbi:hypothetical protein ACFOOK_19090 [Micromonospora krabiensis]|uniref:Membrane domain of glycerophosphoryl diester phosphodiesterase n=1 Tax=Micromonospora krabiensis TaxID=307121 RepID=A0A1C3N9R1_9ACTN|nr:hypothetical protein [Micromonospora krabiensis]SBV29322.1 hypothetical protein GA0070620_4894 [Micromonospora krabiensis]
MSDQPPPAAPPPGPSDPSGAQPPSDPTAPHGGQPRWDPAAPQGQAGPQPGWDPAAPQGQAGWGPNAPQGWGPPPGVSPAGYPVGAGYPPGIGYPPGAGYPPPGGYPPGGPYGGQHWYPGMSLPGWAPPGLDPADLLVTPPGLGLSGWLDRCLGAVRRGWRILLPILLLTQVLPAAALSVLSYGIDPSAEWETSTGGDPAALPDNFVSDLATVLLVLVGGSLVLGFVQGVGWAAGTWVVTRQAAGEPVGLGAALRYGLRRALGLWGWTLLIAVLVGLGFCFCVLPGVYLAFALSMAGPVYLYERDNPIGRSFRMFHDRLGMLLGRLALLFGAVIVFSVVVSVLEGVGTAPFGTDPFAAAGSAAGVVAVIAVTSTLALPAHLAQLVGLVVTYAEQRGQEAPVNSARLAAELG